MSRAAKGRPLRRTLMLRGKLLGRRWTSGSTAPPAEWSADEPVLNVFETKSRPKGSC